MVSFRYNKSEARGKGFQEETPSYFPPNQKNPYPCLAETYVSLARPRKKKFDEGDEVCRILVSTDSNHVMKKPKTYSGIAN